MGFGKEIFEFFMDDQRVMPHTLGYDKPTSLFLSFLSKHYGLNYFVPQTNNFVVYTNYFSNDSSFRCMKTDPI